MRRRIAAKAAALALTIGALTTSGEAGAVTCQPGESFRCTQKASSNGTPIFVCDVCKKLEPAKPVRLDVMHVFFLGGSDYMEMVDPEPNPPPKGPGPPDPQETCFKNREQPWSFTTLGTRDVAGSAADRQRRDVDSFFRACLSNALKGTWDATGGFVTDVCKWSWSRANNTSLLASDLAAVARAGDAMMGNLVEMALSPEDNVCTRGVRSFQAMPPEQQLRRAVELCRATSAVVTGAIVGRGLTGLVSGLRGAPASSEFIQLNLGIKATVATSRITPVSGVVRSLGVFGEGKENVIHRVLWEGEEILVKVPKPGKTTIERELQRFPTPRYGGKENCQRGTVKIDVNGTLEDGIAMTKIDGFTLDKAGVVRQSHVASFEEILANLRQDGKILSDMHVGNVMIGSDGKVYIVDQKVLTSPWTGAGFNVFSESVLAELRKRAIP
ncbi:MAG: hypothetical protein JST00_07150 [Deltaproteobacteria bacterium]|nr:hypothetical protein [Deltaproteobacteria bacterium]